MISADKTESFVYPTLLLLRGEFTVRAKFAGKVLGARRIILLTSIILSGVVVVIGTTGVVVGVVAIVLVR